MSINKFRRWEKAQYAEKEFWGKEYLERRRNTESPDKKVKELWEDMLRNGFGLDYSYFANKDVLEIGCGPSGIIFSISEAKKRFGLEPIDLGGLLIQEPFKLDIVRHGVGENIPFGDESFDVVICFNVLDHCYDPSRVIEQSWRVLRKSGSLLLWVHALRNNYGLFQSLLNKIDRPHPNHFTAEQIIQIANEFLTLERVKRLKGVGEPARRNLKITLGNYLTENVWLVYKKVDRCLYYR
jgi:SAM-dependent methyltransferase